MTRAAVIVAALGAFSARGLLESGVLEECDIRSAELARARHALAYLKARIGDDAMRELLATDVESMSAQVRDWVERSNGRWRTGHIELIVPGPPAAAFHAWYEQAMAERRETMLRAGHPEHFILHPGDAGIEVVENIGETDLPWRVVYRSLPDDAFPIAWEESFPIRFGAELVDGSGLRVGYTMHQARDADDGMHLLMRTLLPEAAPASLVERHLRHFAIEFSNWTHAAWREAQEPTHGHAEGEMRR